MRVGTAISGDQSVPAAATYPSMQRAVLNLGGGHRTGRENEGGFRALHFASRFMYHGIVAGYHRS